MLNKAFFAAKKSNFKYHLEYASSAFVLEVAM